MRTMYYINSCVNFYINKHLELKISHRINNNIRVIAICTHVSEGYKKNIFTTTIE